MKYFLRRFYFEISIWSFILNRGLGWEFLGQKLIILTTFFVKLQSVEGCYNSKPRQESSSMSQ